MSVSEKVLDAIQLLANNSVEKAGYDKTIQAQVLSCQDATIGRYRCRYQDAVIYAYSGSSDVAYTTGSYVYILVPNGDMNKEKTILGTTNRLGINYISQAQGDEAYSTIGTNCVEDNNTFYLDTSNKNYIYALYDYNRKVNDIKLDIQSLNQYIKQSSSLIAGATFKTNIDIEKQYRGHYGIAYNLRFLDNTSNQEVVRSYIIDEDNMIDNPYRLLYKTRQYQIFDIDGSNFIRVQSIEIFNKDFPNAAGAVTGKRLTSGDIEITDLELSGAQRFSESEISGIAISFFTPQGTFFTDSSTAADYKTITAQIRVKGKLVSSVQKIPFYWGSENVGITPSNQYYNKYLGRGWKCLNDSNLVAEGTETTNPIVEWVPGKDTFILNFDQATARDNKFKVAIIYDGTVVTKEINIQNLSSKTPKLTIDSDGGTQFYYDIGHPTLTCRVNGGEPQEYSYYWAYQSDMGVFEQLPETTQLNQAYQKDVTNLKNLNFAISAGTKFANAEAENLNNLQTKVNSYNFIQRVEKNKVRDVQINNITSFGIFKCSVYNTQGKYLGTASITLTNTLEGEKLYSLVINNGSAIYQYNENGVAPNNKSLDVQQEIAGLSFSIYNNLGQEIDNSILANNNNCKIRWYFPIKDTMLVDQKQNGNNSGTDATQTYRYYDNITNLIYNIAQKYDVEKQRNQIKLTVNYKGMNLTAETNLTFTKQGQPGTNGTQYVVKLVPNTRLSNPPLWPMITKAGSNYILNYGINTQKSEHIIGTNANYQLFKAQLWHSGELVWEGFSASNAAKDGVTKPSLVHWDILKNKYNLSFSDASAFTITDANSGRIRYQGDHLASDITTPYANIIKCSITWQGKTYYGTIPITTAWTLSDKYKVGLKDYTGFRYAIYESDGTTPQYDNSHPFEFTCEEEINGVWEDISNVSGEHSVSYWPNAIGDYYSTGSQIGDNEQPINANLLTLLNSDVYRDGCQKNQWYFRPASRYDGVCVNEAVICVYRQGDSIIGRINVPIHFLLNRYGLSQINEWDGNSVQLDNEGGLILTPQMGAGKKENDNSFTGVLMGQTRIPRKNTSQVGLLGYNKGDRTFFLNSKSGSALFGRSNQAQIVIDPSANQKKAMIYSGNFWKQYNADGDYDGLPSSYEYRNKNYSPAGNNNKMGMLIDLTTPEIYFGTGNFYVTKEGYIHASAGGEIGGWKIDKHSLYSNIAQNKGRITLDAGTYDENTNTVTGPGKIYSHSHSELTNTGTGFYLSHNGLSFGSKTKISNDGKMYLGNGAVQNGGTNSDGGRYWTIDGDSNKSYIAYGGNKWSAAKDDNGLGAKVYLGTDGISIGSRFSVNNLGELKAYSGTIGGWNLTKTAIKSSSGNITLNSNGSMSGGTNANYSWSIGQNGQAVFNRLIANGGGSVGGWRIGATTLSSNNVTLHSDGAINGNGWSITSGGLAHFSQVYGQVANNCTFVGGGTTITGGGGGGGGSTNLTAGSTSVGGKSLNNHIKDLVIERLDVQGSITFQKRACSWQAITYINSIDPSWASDSITYLSSVSLSGDPKAGYTLHPSYSTKYRIATNLKMKWSVKSLFVLASVRDLGVQSR